MVIFSHSCVLLTEYLFIVLNFHSGGDTRSHEGIHLPFNCISWNKIFFLFQEMAGNKYRDQVELLTVDWFLDSILEIMLWQSRETSL